MEKARRKTGTMLSVKRFRGSRLYDIATCHLGQADHTGGGGAMVVGGMARDNINRWVRRLAWRRQQQRRLAGPTTDEALMVICCRNDPVARARRGGR